jgi:hypothetical protein
LLEAVQAEWKQFQESFAKRKYLLTRESEVILHCVPITVRRRTVVLGFRSVRDYRAFAYKSNEPYTWSLQGRAEAHMRRFFKKPYLKVSSKLVSPDAFEEASNL